MYPEEVSCGDGGMKGRCGITDFSVEIPKDLSFLRKYKFGLSFHRLF